MSRSKSQSLADSELKIVSAFCVSLSAAGPRRKTPAGQTRLDFKLYQWTRFLELAEKR